MKWEEMDWVIRIWWIVQFACLLGAVLLSPALMAVVAGVFILWKWSDT